MIKQTLLVIFILLSTTNSAMAYIDPGIGAIFAQGLIGAIAAFSLFFSKVRDTLRRVLGLAKGESDTQTKPEREEQPETGSKSKKL